MPEDHQGQARPSSTSFWAMTHPVVLKREGESYRFRLQQIVNDLHLEDHVIFYNRFVDDVELQNWLCAADIYVTPYLDREQLTSGTLAFAVGTGKVVVSTPYWAAEELLADGRGRLVPFGDSAALAAEIVSVLSDDATFYALRRAAYDYGRLRTWPRIGQVYWELINQIGVTRASPLQAAGAGGEAAVDIVSTVEVPEPMLDHLSRLTDDTGLLQHSKFTVPQRTHGYCTDDNARALMAMAKYYQQYPDAEALRLFDIYLSFVLLRPESGRHDPQFPGIQSPVAGQGAGQRRLRPHPLGLRHGRGPSAALGVSVGRQGLLRPLRAARGRAVPPRPGVLRSWACATISGSSPAPATSNASRS